MKLMKIIQINSTCGIGSTGKICVDISKLLDGEQIENYILCSQSNGYPLAITCSDHTYIKVQALKSKVLGNYGFNSRKATIKMIDELKRIKPTTVHLHNIHGHDCNLEILFTYFKKHNTKLIWTFHDCWAFTAYCPYFDLVKCQKWTTGCEKCPQARSFSWFTDRSAYLYNKKRKLFEGLDLTIVTPSDWLAVLAKQSFLKDYPVKVINNGMDLSIFRMIDSNFREKYEIDQDTRILLGVAFDWGKRKGLDVFLELANRLDEKKYRIVLVGTNDTIDKQLPKNIISVHRTQNQQELSEIYSAAELFINPTREENFPTVNMESLACGTPVLTFRTGGSSEMLDETCGSVIECDDIDALEKEIIRICETKPYSKEACLKKARSFDKNVKYEEYIKLYGEEFE